MILDGWDGMGNQEMRLVPAYVESSIHPYSTVSSQICPPQQVSSNNNYNNNNNQYSVANSTDGPMDGLVLVLGGHSADGWVDGGLEIIDHSTPVSWYPSPSSKVLWPSSTSSFVVIETS